MRKILLLLLLACCATLQAQTLTKSKFYSLTSWEFMLSGAAIDNNGKDEGSVVRFSGVVNWQNHVHYDISDKAGLFFGTSIHNVGFIYNVPDSGVKKKFRTYNIGIPIGLKVGNMEKESYLYGGYELEFPFNYKEKTFEDERKTDKFSVWFSGRVPVMYHSLMLGYHSPKGIGLKFKYYLTGFFNQDYEGTDPNGQPYKPYQGFNAHVFYFAVTFDLFKNLHFYYTPAKEGDMKQARLIE